MIFGDSLPSMRAGRDGCPFQNLNAFDKLLFKHIAGVGSNKMRSAWLGLTRGLTSDANRRCDRNDYYQHLNRHRHQPGPAGRRLNGRHLGGSLKRRRHLSARLGDVLGPG